MAPKKFYLPNDDEGKVLWLNNFAAKFPSYAIPFGFVAADVTSVNNDRNMWSYLVNIIEQNKADMKEFTQYKIILRGGPVGTPTDTFPVFTPGAAVPTLVAADIFGRIGKMVQIIKSKPNYTEAIGDDLKIIGAESTFDPNTFFTDLDGTAYPGLVRIEFFKSGCSAMNIYSKLPSEPNWVKIGTPLQSPFDDTRPLQVPNQPEVRQYQARGVIGNNEIGQMSATIQVAFAG